MRYTCYTEYKQYTVITAYVSGHTLRSDWNRVIAVAKMAMTCPETGLQEYVSKTMKSKIKEKKKTNKIKPLLISLFLSACCFVVIVIYALNWEQIHQIDWSRFFPEPEIMEAYYEITNMSHSMPVLTKKAEEGMSIIPVPLINQKECGYLTGCELVSGTMVLNYYDKEVTPQDLYEVIEKVPEPVDPNGTGIDPRVYFIGDPKRSNGFGCYAEPLIEAMNKVFSGERYAVNISGTSLETIEKEYLAEGTPVIIWATIHMSEPEQGNQWQLEDGTEFQWLAGEHCLVLVGADDNYYYFNDPDHAGEVIGYEKEIVEKRYQQLGRQAIIVSR